MRGGCITDICIAGSSATVDSVVSCFNCFVKRRTRPAGERALASALRIAVQHGNYQDELWLEFGAYSGASTMIMRNASLAWARRDDVHSFDSFM